MPQQTRFVGCQIAAGNAEMCKLPNARNAWEWEHSRERSGVVRTVPQKVQDVANRQAVDFFRFNDRNRTGFRRDVKGNGRPSCLSGSGAT